MAVDNDTKLTKFKSATTIVTADYANSIFGGLYGSSEADNLAPDDPRVIGHVHDGINADGHVGKIDLVDHVDNQLLNINLADDAVTKRNVRETLYPSEAIPEYEIIGGSTYYYLDLGSVRADFPLIEDPVSPSGTPGIIRQRSEYYDGSPIVGVWGTLTGRDFVFGSSSLDDLASGGDGDSRLIFDKSLSAFRAGRVSSDQWDEVNRGPGSAAFGLNNTASGNGTFAMGFSSVVSGDYSASFGNSNTVDSAYSLVVGRDNIAEALSEYAMIYGNLNEVSLSTDEYDLAELPKYASAIGKEAYAHIYGQHVQSSGAFDPDTFEANGFPVGVPLIPAPNQWYLLLPDKGSAQGFTLTMFGAFQYASSNIEPKPTTSPTKFTTEQRFIANIDGGLDSDFPDRVFRPRRGSAYSIKTIGCLSFSEVRGSLFTPRVIRHSVTFEIHSGIAAQYDGSIMYDTDSFLITFDSRDTILSGGGRVQVNFPKQAAGSYPLTGRAGKDDFRIWFTHDTAATNPVNRSPGLLGSAPSPGYGFSFLVENRSFLNNASPNTTESGAVFVAEALTVRMEVTELNMSMGGFPFP